MSDYSKQLIKYCNDIEKKKILSCIWVKKAVKRFQNDLSRSKDEDFLYEYKQELADEVLEFAESLHIPDIKREDGSNNLILLPWQIFIFCQLYGWVHKLDNDKRRFRSGFAEIGRKNGKTTGLLFPLIIYDFLTTDSAESYFVSKDGNQSVKSFKELLHIIKADKTLAKSISETVQTITIDHSRIAFFSSESTGIDGYRNSMTVIDEFHAYDNDRIVTASRYGGRARKNNLTLIITSAGNDISGPCYAENQKCKKILSNGMTDETYFGIVYSYDEKDDWKDKKNYIKANPSLGTFLPVEVLDIDLQDALITPHHQPDFQSKTCGIWSNGVSTWIPLDKWENGYKINESDLVGQECYAAFDLSNISDFTAYTLYFKVGKKFCAKHHFYIPESTIKEKFMKDNISILEWCNNGIITPIPGNTIDYEYIYKDIYEDNKKYKIREIAYDSWQSNFLVNKIEQEMNHIALIPYGQSLKQMGPGTKLFEKTVLDGNIIDPNPVMAWMVSNVVVKSDANGNYKPLKENKTSTKRIDGVITSIMAFDRLKANENIISKDYSFEDLLDSI